MLDVHLHSRGVQDECFLIFFLISPSKYNVVTEVLQKTTHNMFFMYK